MKKKSRNNTNIINIKVFLRVLIAIVLIVSLYGICLLVARVASVQAVECKLTTAHSCSNELQQATSPILGHSMFFVNYEQVLIDAQSISQPVSLVNVEKRLPNTVTLTFQPEPAVYAIDTNDQLTMVSQSGKTFISQTQETDLLTVDTSQPLITEQGTVPPDIHHAILAILSTASELQLSLNKVIWVDKSTIQLSMENREELFVLDSSNPRLQLHKLSLVLKSSEYKDISEPKQELDLRFNMPVLRTQP